MTMSKHLLSIKDLSKTDIVQILDVAEGYLQQPKIPLNLLLGKWVANVFFEPSTRTRSSFEIAAKRLGAEVLNLPIESSSTQKGEAIFDTFLNLEAMGCDLFVIRHAENGMVARIAERLQTACVINAGDGQNQHPTQALLDMLTIRQHKPDFSQLTVTLVGDVAHSRVARSDILALQILGVKKIRVVAPPELLPKNSEEFNQVEILNDLSEGLSNADVVIALRIQKERMLASETLDVEAFTSGYRITADALKLAKPDVIVMHPGPLNRGVEMTSEVADGSRSLILRQVTNGVVVRMAVLARSLSLRAG